MWLFALSLASLEISCLKGRDNPQDPLSPVYVTPTPALSLVAGTLFSTNTVTIAWTGLADVEFRYVVIDSLGALIDDYACSAPFGVETLHVFARTEDFEPVQTLMEGRTRILKGDLKDFLYATRGMNKIDKSVKQAEAKLILTTIDALRSR
jgi:hypothetical protein